MGGQLFLSSFCDGERAMLSGTAGQLVPAFKAAQGHFCSAIAPRHSRVSMVEDASVQTGKL
jgi:hypothetical protein